MTVAPVTINALIKAGGHHETWFDRLFTWFVDRYTEVLSWCLGHKIVVVVLSVVMLAGSGLAAVTLATEFFPKVDAGQFIVNVSAPEGTRVEKTEAIIEQVETIIKEETPTGELDQIVANIGLPHGWMVMFTPVSGPHQAFLPGQPPAPTHYSEPTPSSIGYGPGFRANCRAWNCRSNPAASSATS